MVVIGLVLYSLFKGDKKISYIAVVLLYLFSTPIVSDGLFKQVEGDYGYPPLATMDTADAVVVLSGMLRINEWENYIAVEWGGASDRFFRGLELYEAGKAGCIVFTAGKTPYNQTHLSEGDILQKEARKRGMPSTAILQTQVALNTAEEAHAVAALLESDRKIILVTSAFHMKRAQLLFERQGFEVQPYKVDFRTPPLPSYNGIDFLPSAQALFQTELAFRELLGRLYYGVYF